VRFDTAKSEGCTPITDGSIVLASTDMGHQGMGGAWGDDAQKRADFAYRGVHVAALAAKALIKAFYGQTQRFAYFAGCSDGGREALIEAQRYPDDFDGITAGAPALNFTVQNSFHHGWLAKVNTGADGKAVLTWPDAEVLHTAALKACDGLDGLVDGQITDPRACHFDPATTLCKGGYDGAHSASGKLLEVGPLQPGSELEWRAVFIPRDKNGFIGSEAMAAGTINALLFTPNPATPYTSATFPFTEAMYAQEEPARALYSADNADLSAFAGRGGKLILWHGWSDPHISPLNTIDYYERVGAKMGRSPRDAFVRLFLFPGMGHCAGGEGPSEFPLLAGVMAWVEGGVAPQVMVAHRTTSGGEDWPVPPKGAKRPPAAMGPPAGMFPPPAKLPPRSRPVFAYPQVAGYTGTGSVDDANSFAAVAGAPINGLAQWIGAGR
jgi:feruloyl esterase